MDQEARYELKMQLMHEAILEVLSRGIERNIRSTPKRLPQTALFRGVGALPDDLDVIATAAATLVRVSGNDLQTG
jgi:hypothetical protein